MNDDYEVLSDEELVRKVREGQPDIMDCLVTRYKGMVRKKAYTMYLIGGETEDLIQEGMIGLFKAIRDYREDRESSFQTFASLCIDRQLYKAVTSSQREKHSPLNNFVSLEQEEENLTGLTPIVYSPEEILLDQENTRDLLEQIQNALSEMENCVLKYHLEGYDYIKIAEKMNRQPKAIDNALQRIRNKVKMMVDK